MRKNAINRGLRPIDGGVCAPEGYTANGIACGIKRDGALDLAMIYSERRCAVGCLFANGKTVGAPVAVSRYNMRSGYARAVLVNSGVATALQMEGERFSFDVCDLLFPYGVERMEIVYASTGKMGKLLNLEPFQVGISPLWEGLERSNVHSQRVAEAISTEDSKGKELSFAFDLGDYPCKMGAIFKGGKHVSPNMATFLVFLTTDVNISTPMLQKALVSEVRETLNVLCLDGVSSPNDTVCILANGRAGNYKIDREDSEFKKFRYALRAVLTEVCMATAKSCGRLLTCRVSGAISKEVARSVSKAIAGAVSVKRGIVKGEIDSDGLLCIVLSKVNVADTCDIQIALRLGAEEIVVYEDERVSNLSIATKERLLLADEVGIVVHLRTGNYQSIAYGCL